MKKKKNFNSVRFCTFFCGSLLRSLDGNLTEFLKVLHKSKSGLAGAGASGFVTLNYLSLSVLCEFGVLSNDLFNKCFHCFGNY